MKKTPSDPLVDGPHGLSTQPVSSVSGELRRAFDVAAIGMGIVAVDGRWLSANAALSALVGYTQDELLSLSLQAVTHAPDVAADLRAIERLLLGELGVHEREKRLIHRAGGAVWVHQQLTVSYDNGGRPMHLLWQGRDITEHRRTREALHTSDASFRTLIEQVPEMILVHRNGLVVYANPAAEAALRPEHVGELLGRDLAELVPEEERAALATRIERMVRTGEPSPPQDFHFLRRGAGAVAVELVGVPLVFDGEPAVVSIARDVTERRQLQTHLVETDRLVALGTLVAGVAHEINNPLTYVVRNIELCSALLRARAEEHRSAGLVSGGGVAELLDDLASTMKVALDGVDRVAHIVRDLTTFARGESDRRTVLDVRAVLEPVLRLVSNEIRQRARLTRDLGDVPLVEANKARLGQVLVNLLLNAAQAIPEGRAEDHEISVKTFTDEAGRAVIQVSDTGSGIPEALMGRIFEPFFTTKPTGMGTGLGLSICHGIVTTLGGEITVRSAPGAGSVFRVTIPAAPLGRHPPPGRMPGPPPWARGARRGRILVVDDEPLIGQALSRSLSGHDVRAVMRARDALDAVLAGDRFDMILCDLLMPGMTGIDLYDALASAAPDQARRIVFMTGGAFTDRARAFLDRVTSPRLSKPLDMTELLALIEDGTARKGG